MAQSLANVLVHIIFSTKERFPFLQEMPLREEMHRYLSGISRTLDCPSIRVGGTANHVHLLARQARTVSLSEWIKELKRVSSIWIKTKSDETRRFQWQSGYGAFSVSESKVPIVDHYIARQDEHHHRMSFQEEFRILLKKHKLEFDERYVWD